MTTRTALVLGIALLLAAAGVLAVRRALGADLVRVQVERQLSARLGQPVHVGSAGASAFPVSIDLSDLTIGEPASVRLGRVHIMTGMRALISRQVADAELVVEDGRVTWPLPFALGGAAPATGTATP